MRSLTDTTERLSMFVIMAVCALSCTDRTIVGPQLRSDTIPVTQRAMVAGCTVFQLTPSADRRQVAVDTVHDAGCSGLLKPVLDTVVSPSISAAGVVTFTRRLHNLSAAIVTAPAAVQFIAGAQPNWTSPTNELRFDSVLAASGRPQVLHPGALSRSRVIQLTLAPNGPAVRITIRATAPA